MQNLNNVENTVLGAATAVVAVVALQPTVYLKNAAQQGRSAFTLNPRILYRGMGAALSAEIGQMALQFFLTGYIKRLVAGAEQAQLNPVQEMSSALLGGAISAIYTSPVELAMIQQQNFGGSLFSTAGRIVQQRGVVGLTRGFVATASRDGVYTLGLLGILPVLESRFQRWFGLGESSAGVLASCLGGSLCGVASCPLDAIKTCMQGDINRSTYGSFRNTWSMLQKEKRLFGGVGWRVLNISGTLIIANEFRIRATPYLFPGKVAAGGAGHH